MHSLKSPSALTIAAAMMRMVWCGVWSRLGFTMAETEFDLAIQNWVAGIFRKFDEMLAQYRAGTLQPEAPRPVVTTRRASPQQPPEADRAVLRLTAADLKPSCAADANAGGDDGVALDVRIVCYGLAAVGFGAICKRLGRGLSACGALFISNFRKMGWRETRFYDLIVPVCD